MSAPVLLLCLCAFALLGALPIVFFRRGRLTAGWCVTALPFAADGVLLIAALAGVIAPAPLASGYAAALTLGAVPLIAAAIALTAYTAGVHRAPISLWHQEQDQPRHLVTTGPYARIRHPFYTSFILMLAGTAAAFPHPATAALLCLGALQLHRTARREERRILASPLRVQYQSYMARTGRFVPRRVRSASVRAAPTGSRYSTAPANSPAATPRPARD